MKLAIVTTALLFQSLVFAQTGPTLVSAGYTDPSTTVTVAPGQDLTFYLAGVKTVLPAEVHSGSYPLPISLGGFSAQITQLGSGSVFPVPFYSVRQINICAQTSVDPACLVTALRVQIPFEIGVPPVYGQPNVGLSQIVFQSPDGASEAFAINPVHYNIHFARECAGVPVCLTHADGSLVAGVAQAGEVVSLYAYGLGATTPAVKSGYTSPAPPATANSPYQVFLNYAGAAPITETPLFAGLSPGFAGLYQINFKVPSPPPGTVPCFSSSFLQGNLSITIANQGGYEPGPGLFQDPVISDTLSVCVNP